MVAQQAANRAVGQTAATRRTKSCIMFLQLGFEPGLSGHNDLAGFFVRRPSAPWPEGQQR